MAGFAEHQVTLVGVPQQRGMALMLVVKTPMIDKHAGIASIIFYWIKDPLMREDVHHRSIKLVNSPKAREECEWEAIKATSCADQQETCSAFRCM